MRYEKTVTITRKQAEFIARAMSEEPLLGEDEAITNTCRFKDGMEMDVKCCGVQPEEGSDNLAWSEAVLFNEMGGEVARTDASDEYIGAWEVEYDGNIYCATVAVEA